MKRITTLFIATALLTSGCTWFSREKSSIDISELTDIATPLATRVNWSKDVGEGTDDEGVRLVVSLDGSTVYVANFGGEIQAVNTQNGSTLWSQDVDMDLGGGPGVGSGLVIVGTTDGDVIALGQSSGNESWRAKVSTA